MRIALVLAALFVGCSSPSSPPAASPPDGAPDDAEAASPISAWPLASPADALTGIRALARMPSNDWVVVGSQSPKTTTAKGVSDAWFARIGSDGATKQTRTWSNEAFSVVNAVAVSADGSIFACGSSQTADGQMDAWVQRRTADLELVWSRTLDGDAHFADSGIGLALDDAGNVAVVGFTDRNASAVSSSVLIWKLDPSGATVHRAPSPTTKPSRRTVGPSSRTGRAVSSSPAIRRTPWARPSCGSSMRSARGSGRRGTTSVT